MKYKNLKSVAHNLGHSFMSLMNYTSGDYMNGWLLQIAKRSGNTEIIIDLLNENIEPSEFRTDVICSNIKNYRDYFPKELVSQKCSIEHVKEVKMKINFDLSKTEKSKNTDLDLPIYDCIVEILDDRNMLHKANVLEWWKY